MTTPRNQQLIKAINKMQSDRRFFPLICPDDHTHRLLCAEERNGEMVLACPDCLYITSEIPEAIIALCESEFKTTDDVADVILQDNPFK